MPSYLVVEDSLTCQVVVKRALSAPDAQISTAVTLSEAMGFLGQEQPFDLVLLDLVLPDGDGLEFLSSMQSSETHRNTPIFLLTSKEDIASKISAFSLGADDYLTKPINPTELKARMEMRLRKAKSSLRDVEVLRRGKLTINLPMMRVSIEGTGGQEEVDLTAKEFKILAFLAQNEGKVLNRAEIVSAIWGKTTHVVQRTIDSHVCGIRRKIKDCSAYLESIPGAGYRFLTKT